MSTTIAPQDDEQELAFRPPRRTTTNASVDFIENTVSQAEESRYVPEYDRFLPKDEAEAQMDAM